MSNNRNNPKALKLDGLDKLNRKVTIGFKCNPKIKLFLAGEAIKAGITLSEYIESLIQALDTAVLIERNEVNSLKEKVAFYENNILMDFFKDYEGKEVKYDNNKGESMKLVIKEPKDVYTIIINSYKAKK